MARKKASTPGPKKRRKTGPKVGKRVPKGKPLTPVMTYQEAVMARKAEARAKVGHPEWIPGEETVKEVFEMASRGMQRKNIAAYIGISYETLGVKLRQYPQLQTALEEGYKVHETKHLIVLDDVAEKRKMGAVQASIFKLKACHKYRDNDSVEASDGNSRNPEAIQKAILAAIARVEG